MDRTSSGSYGVRSREPFRPSRSSRSNRSYTERTRSKCSRGGDDASDSSHLIRNTTPVWSDSSNSAAGSVRDEDVFADDARSRASSGGSISNQGSTIVGTFRPPLEDMVEVNVSSHGKNFPNSSNDGLFRKRTDDGIRRSSDFALSAEDMEYDAVGMTKRRYLTGALCGLMAILAVITIAVVALVGKSKSGSFPATVATNPFPTSGGSIVDPPVSKSDCNFDNILEPDVFLQCRCTGYISTFAEGVLLRYTDLRTNFVTQNVFPNFNFKMDSCDPPNLALVWLAADEYPQTEEMFDRYMLALLYAAWKGYFWTHQDNWLLNSESHCEWYGVECDSSRRTTALLLGNNNLQGEIPSEIIQFESLRSLDIGENKIDGRIPTEIGQFQSLVNLRLSLNSLILSIPTEFGLLENLKSLEVDHNNVAGTIPTEIFRIPNLEFVDLSSNNLSGTIPTQIGLVATCRK